MAGPYNIVSADSHLEIPPDTWGHWVPKQYRDRAPRKIRMPDGGDGYIVEGRAPQRGGMNLFSGTPPEEFVPHVRTLLDRVEGLNENFVLGVKLLNKEVANLTSKSENMIETYMSLHQST